VTNVKKKLEKLLKRHEIEQQPYDNRAYKKQENHVKKVWKLGLQKSEKSIFLHGSEMFSLGTRQMGIPLVWCIGPETRCLVKNVPCQEILDIGESYNKTKRQ